MKLRNPPIEAFFLATALLLLFCKLVDLLILNAY
jgi:hypothetical protein